MITRKEERAKIRERNFLFELVKTKEHFFKDLNIWLKDVKDRRNRSYIKYEPDEILLPVILKNIMSMESMRQMSTEFNRDEVIENVRVMLSKKEMDELPHYDTVNDFLEMLPPEELEKVRERMIKNLLKKRSLERYRISGRFWGIIFDGTGLYSFKKKHCEHCLKREYKDKDTGEIIRTVYMHHVLEAKLIVGDMVLSLGTEFIENESEDVQKQDCELKAFRRLAGRIKKTYPRLPICVLADGLYPSENVFRLMKEYSWQYILRFKDGSIPSVASEFQTIQDMGEAQKKGVFTWVNGIGYNHGEVNLVEQTEMTKKKTTTFTFITNLEITKANAAVITAAGRSRWKIENEGFNNQKNIRYYIQHVNSYDYTAMKNHYLLTQIADIIMQLFINGTAILKLIKMTAKEISSRLLEAIRTRILTAEDMTLTGRKAQVRFT